ncbi:MBL fold metallo-hydrolase [Breoghania sp. L-A4]|uniref:MBL fold metallo-hydrolase n=1 Tax=Breoghania sp. L-A4 TaxID=2304600 RepID=UPI000E35CD1A|nr:MBL fold metallo-hydrolase [Breoghania sp. L-A4]AXS40668.1 MBL fold metallo-hydrolase [Breoghania sp. L-A4]
MSARFEFTILGCGSSGGVPRIGNVWGACDPEEPRNRRKRCSLLVRRFNDADGVTTVLIDTGPDVRQQMLDAGVGHVDAVLYTHAHADHIHGIDDLRMIAIHNHKRVPVYMDLPTSARAHEAFDYCFHTPEGSSYPPILEEHRITPGVSVVIDGEGGPIEALPVVVRHGDIDALGFRINDLAYLPDVKDIPADSVAAFSDLDIWILDALRPTPHPSHFSLDDALLWIARMKPRHAVITNMHVHLDYRTLADTLPAGVEPAYDGMKLVVED